MMDRELTDLPPKARWQEWLLRIEAVLFASASPVPRGDLLRVIGADVSLEKVLDDLRDSLKARPYELLEAGGGYLLTTRPCFSAVITAAADTTNQSAPLSEKDGAVLMAIALEQPITRAGLRDIFGAEPPRSQITRLQGRDLIETGPRDPNTGAVSYVTTAAFLAQFGLASLSELEGISG